ncbi:MAG TPA: nucleotidyl transferase AbiEii/AbiGii toxin family protein [Pirellulales bacterium]|jgi:predicted nucleotidyltransferase|nr:nucleotidyl transferase AbiEii/AbiGii toxin family protein [Pirellulales bacterium]
MKELSKALAEFTRLFDRLNVQYAVMGGIAVRAHGIPRPTQDVDFTVAIQRDHLQEFYDAARLLGYSIPEEYASGWVDQVAGMPLVRVRNYTEGKSIDVDVFLAESPFQRELLARARIEQVDDLAIRVVTPEDLILLKLLARRPRDLGDVGDILFTQGELDEAYLRHWAKELGVLAELENALAEPPPI